jgi:uncharacterized protein (TIGR02594 family)
MAASTYDDALRRLLVHEGGYSNHPSDPGGPTNFGITIADYRAYVKPDATADDVRNMTVDDAKRIYRKRYWDAQRCDELPAGVDYSLFDYGVNSGIGRSGKVLRRVVGVPDNTSAFTDQVLAYARVRDPKVLVAAVCDERLAFLKSLRTWPVFGRGWGTRVAEVKAVSLALAGATQGVTPSEAPTVRSGTPPWLARMNAILGLYEFAGAADNPAILGMARACGGNIARTYKHDATPWCALTVNYCLVASGLPGNDSLWALDFARYGNRLDGAAVGAIATKKRDGGGHVFLVVGRTKDGRIVGRGGNQSDMVCDEVFDPSVITAFTWPKDYPAPSQVGFDYLPIVPPAPKARRELVLPPPTQLELPAKGVVPPPRAAKEIITKGVPAGGAAGGIGFWDWIAAHPLETAGLALVGAGAVGGAVYALNRWHQARHEAPTPSLVPIAA